MKNFKSISIILFCLFCVTNSSFAQVVKLKSTETDFYTANGNYSTAQQTCYHTLDLNQNVIVLESGKEKMIFSIKSSYKQGDFTIYVINEQSIRHYKYSSSLNMLVSVLADGTQVDFLNLRRM